MKTYMVLDYETTGLNFYGKDKHRWFSFSLSRIEDGYTEVFYGRSPSNVKILRDFWRDTSIAKIAHNTKFEITVTVADGIIIPKETELHDTMIMAQYIDNSLMSYALDSLTNLFTNYTTEYDKEVERWSAMTGGRYDKIPKEIMIPYQIADGERTALLFNLFYDDLKKDRNLYEMYQYEIELLRVTQKIEERGIKIDRSEINKMIEEYHQILLDIQNRIYEICGTFINLNSPKQVSELLFSHYKLPAVSVNKSGSVAIDKDCLLSYLNNIDLKIENEPKEVVELILKYRSYGKGIAMFNNYLRNADEKDILHPQIRTNHAKTGRQSCSNPNLQNVQKEASLKNLFPIPARRAFIVEGKEVFIYADYSGIEMRLIINSCNEIELLEILKAGKDVHHPTVECFMMPGKFNRIGDDIFNDGVLAAQTLMLNAEEYSVMRSAYKNVGFGIAYGAGQPTIANTLGKTVFEIEDGFVNYCKRFQKIAGFTHQVMDKVLAKGYVLLPQGRKLRINRSKAYAAANLEIQGTAALILKKAQVNLYKYFEKEFKNEIKLVLPIHDELIFSVPRKYLSNRTEILSNIRRIMIDQPEITVPLDVEFKMTTFRWSEAKKISLK